MEQHRVRVKSVEKVTLDVLKIVTNKPQNYTFRPGQATEVSINLKGWTDKKRPFTFTSLPENDYLEFTIKTYPAHKGVTNQLLLLKTDDELILHDVYGAIAYRGEGIFIAGGAGVTPFISIFRDLELRNEIGGNKLIFANKAKDDIIYEQEFDRLLGNNFINILSDEKVDDYAQGFITKEFLRSNVDDLDKHFYLCGPPPMMDAVGEILLDMHVNEKFIVKEAF